MARKSDFTLPTYDDLFSTQKERDEAQLKKIYDIPTELIDEFPNHPFKVRDDLDMIQLVESVGKYGVLTPAIIRPKADGRYELVSGHRRKRASKRWGISNLQCEIRDLDDDEATILMVESNLQRSTILPSEKAFAYKMRLEAMNRQGKRTDLTSGQVGQKLSRDELAAELGESARQLQRFIRLTNLVPELLEMVDNAVLKEKGILQMSMSPAVELSYLDEDAQRDLVDAIDDNACTPTHAQAKEMRRLFEAGELTMEAITAIMKEDKPNQKEHISLQLDRVTRFIPASIPVTKREEYILKALEWYQKHLRKREERDAR